MQNQERSKTVKEVVEIVVIILILIGGVYGINITLKYTLHTSKPVVVVEGVSMEPTLHEGDILIVKGVKSGEVEIGDIIVFESSESTPHILPNRTVVHRVIDIKYDEEQGQYFYLTKGDNNKTNPIPDGWVPQKDVYGVVIFIIPKVGLISIWLHRTHLAPLIIGILVAVMIILTILGTPEEKQKEKE